MTENLSLGATAVRARQQRTCIELTGEGKPLLETWLRYRSAMWRGFPGALALPSVAGGRL